MHGKTFPFSKYGKYTINEAVSRFNLCFFCVKEEIKKENFCKFSKGRVL